MLAARSHPEISDLLDKLRALTLRGRIDDLVSSRRQRVERLSTAFLWATRKDVRNHL